MTRYAIINGVRLHKILLNLSADYQRTITGWMLDYISSNGEEPETINQPTEVVKHWERVKSQCITFGDEIKKEDEEPEDGGKSSGNIFAKVWQQKAVTAFQKDDRTTFSHYYNLLNGEQQKAVMEELHAIKKNNN